MFPTAFVTEYCNTVTSLLRVLTTERGLVALNRIGSNPVEHLFGLIRMRSRDVHTFEKLKRTLGKIELHRHMKKEFGVGVPVNKRISYYAQTIFCSQVTPNAGLQVNSRDAVIALLKEFGLPISLREIVPWDIESIFALSSDIVTCVFANLRHIEMRINSDKENRTRSSTECKITCGRSILPRLCDNKIIDQ